MMNPYPWLCRHLPGPVVDWAFIVARAILMALVVLYSDLNHSDFAYLRL
jgi:hypothetical protein